MERLIIGYCRISSNEGAERGTSIERQKDLITNYCKFKGLPTPQFHVDEAISGFKNNRPEFQRVISLIKAKRVSHVIVFDLSRLARNVKTTLETVELMEKMNVTFISLSEDIRTDTAVGRCFLTICSSFHQLLRDQTSEKMTITWRHKKERREKGPGSIPFGFDLGPDNKLIENKAEQAVIGQILKLREVGHSLAEIANQLTASGIKSKTGSKFYPSTIKALLERHSEAA